MTGREYRWGTNLTVGLGYIVIASDIERKKFIESCYRRERVNIVVEGGTMIKGCYIDSEVLQRIKFPESIREMGSRVVFILDKFNSIPIIIATVTRTQERLITSEEAFTVIKHLKDGNLSIKGDGSGKLLINLSNIKASKFEIKLNGKESVLSLNSDGVINLYANNDINITSLNKIVQKRLNDSGEVENSLEINKDGLVYKDNKGNKFEIDYEKEIIIHNKGSQPIVLGNELQKQLDLLNDRFEAFVSAFTNTVPGTSDGGLKLQIASKLALVTKNKADFKDIKSVKSFID